MPTKVCIVKAMVFPVVTYDCESWTVKKGEGQRINAFELSCWRRLLKVPCTARRSNQSVLREIERVTGRKAKGLQMEERGCKCQTFLSLISGRRKQTSDILFLLYTNLK